MTAATDRAELRRLLAEATPGPWRAAHHGSRRRYDDVIFVVQGDPSAAPRVPDRYIAHYVPNADAALIVAAVNALPGLLDQLDAAEAALERVRALAGECATSGCIHLNTLWGNLRAALDGPAEGVVE